MWIIQGKVGLDPAEDKSRWLRPLRSYQVGRGKGLEGRDFGWNGPATISKAHMTLKTSSVDKAQVAFSTEANQMSYDPDYPTYGLSVQNDSKKPFRVYRSDGDEEEEFMVQPKESIQIRSGDQCRFGQTSAGGRGITFIWKPVAVSFEGIKDSHDKQTALAQIGIRTGERIFFHGYTHYCAGELKLGPVALLAAMRNGHFVSPDWVDFLLEQAATPAAPRRGGNRIENDAGSDEQYWGFSGLEQDFATAWPSEEPKFPKWKSAEEKRFTPDPKKWAPNSERQTLFAGMAFFIFDEKDKHIAVQWEAMIEAGAGRCFNLYSVQDDPEPTGEDLQAKVEGLLRAENLTGTFDKMFILRAQPGASEPIWPAVMEMATSMGIDGVLQIAELLKVVYEVDLDPRRYGLEKDAAPTPTPSSAPGPSEKAVTRRASKGKDVLVPPSSAVEAPEPSASGSSVGSSFARTAIPSTNPNEASMAPPRQEEATSRQPVEEMPPPAPPTKKKPLVRRAAKDKAFDPMADIFANMPAPTSSVAASQAESAGGNTQGGEVSQSGPTQGSRSSRLKRRAGTTTEGVDDMFFAASKDRNSQGSSGSQSQGNKRQKMDTGEDEPMIDVSGTSQKRKVELVDTPEVVEAKKRLKHQKEFEEKQQAAREAAAEQKKSYQTTAVEDDARAQAEEEKAKYLQIDHGKRKVSAQDKQFTKEFNSLKIAKPKLNAPGKISSEKVKWNGRDKRRDDLEDSDDDWTADAGKSFFVIKTFSVKPKADAQQPRTDLRTDDRWAGLPNFKRFKPKSQLSHETRQAGNQRRTIALVPIMMNRANQEASEARAASRAAEEEDEESEESDTPRLDLNKTQAQKKADAAAKAKATKAAKVKAKPSTRARKAKVIEESEEEEEDELAESMQVDSEASSSTAKSQPKTRSTRATSTAKKPAAKKRPDPPSSDDSDEITFRGFGASQAKRGRR